MALLGVTAVAWADDFAGARMADGIEAYRSRQFMEASDQFRIACFGLLDQPARLSEGLVRLALAQEATGRKESVAVTLKRFLEVERRFKAYASARVDAGLRGEFEAILRARVPAETLAAVPSLSRPGTRSPVPLVVALPAVSPPEGVPLAVAPPAISPPEAVPLAVAPPAVSPPEVESPAAAPPVISPPEGAPPAGALSAVEPLGITPPVPLETPSPAYPYLARRARAEGDVLVEAMVGADGAVREARVLRSASLLLNDAALEAVRRWRYSPARVGEQPVAASINVVVTFSRRNLNRGQAP